MPGAYVFPGGRVDPGDRLGTVELDEESLVRRFSGALSAEEARAHLVAAAREVEEEALLRLPDPAVLRPFSRWVTPTFERKRFDAWFFVARLPDGASPSHDAYEVTASAWVDPRVALDRYGDGGMVFAPPTWHTLWDLARHRGAESVLRFAEGRVVWPVLPRFEEVDGAMAILLPGDPLYPAEHAVDGPTRLVMRGDGRWWAVSSPDDGAR
jgi:8-oxo-dGTP pyrophosphatase MutT (NUDIX family)